MKFFNNQDNTRFELNLKKTTPLLLVVALTMGILTLIPWYKSGMVNAQESNTCPDGGSWIKIDSNDLSLYPVDGAVEYCFKAGNFLTDSIPEGGFGQQGGCSAENIQNCGLSHWSYKLGTEPTNTPSPTASPSPTDTPTATPSATATPTLTITPTPTDAGCELDGNGICIVLDCDGEGTCEVVIGDPSPTPTVTPGAKLTPTQAPTSTPTVESTPTPGSDQQGDSDEQDNEDGEVLGATTLGATGRGYTSLMISYLSVLLGAGLILRSAFEVKKSSN